MFSATFPPSLIYFLSTISVLSSGWQVEKPWWNKIETPLLSQSLCSANLFSLYWCLPSPDFSFCWYLAFKICSIISLTSDGWLLISHTSAGIIVARIMNTRQFVSFSFQSQVVAWTPGPVDCCQRTFKNQTTHRLWSLRRRPILHLLIIFGRPSV